MYKCLENSDKIYKSTGGMDMGISRTCEYSVYWVKNGNITLVADIKDHFQNPRSIGEGIARQLNKAEVVLDLN